ncbi:salivary cystatin-L-like isoform X2 [Varroa jacobsoni]|nr:salivary cystatin-L-like isoform X2 [Varroa destructor]XP_022688935.1 salivary cystatin-L-like isoform X2 [Varroa jacobsoni]
MHMLWLVIAAALLVLAETRKLHGAPEEVAVENALINEVAHYAVENHPGDTLEDGYFDALESIISAENQLVAGTLYTLKLRVGPSGCPLKGVFDRQRCKVKASAASRQCTAKVHVQVWMKPQNAVTHWQCE